MARARDHPPGEVAFDQVSAIMSAQILDAGKLSVDVEERQIEIFLVNELESSGRNLARVGHGNPAGHDCISQNVEYRLQSGPHGIITNCLRAA
jgi:hypothetical protein